MLGRRFFAGALSLAILILLVVVGWANEGFALCKKAIIFDSLAPPVIIVVSLAGALQFAAFEHDTFGRGYVRGARCDFAFALVLTLGCAVLYTAGGGILRDFAFTLTHDGVNFGVRGTEIWIVTGWLIALGLIYAAGNPKPRNKNESSAPSISAPDDPRAEVVLRRWGDIQAFAGVHIEGFAFGCFAAYGATLAIQRPIGQMCFEWLWTGAIAACTVTGGGAIARLIYLIARRRNVFGADQLVFAVIAFVIGLVVLMLQDQMGGADALNSSCALPPAVVMIFLGLCGTAGLTWYVPDER